MANTESGNVIRVDTTANFTHARNIEAIKYVGGAAGTAQIEGNGSDSDLILWSHSGNVTVQDNVCIRDSKGVRVEVSDAVVYLYLK
jgi:hypothetical protein